MKGGGGAPRQWSDPVLFTTYPHVLVAFLATSSVSIEYSCVVLFSTAFSVMWHRYREPHGILFVVDHSAACVWGAYDAYLNPMTLCLSVPVAIANQYMDHSLWHLLHVGKALFVVAVML